MWGTQYLAFLSVIPEGNLLVQSLFPNNGSGVAFGIIFWESQDK
jgi:hypothetical protein